MPEETRPNQTAPYQDDRMVSKVWLNWAKKGPRGCGQEESVHA